MKTKWNKYGYQYRQRWYMSPVAIALFIAAASLVIFLIIGVLM